MATLPIGALQARRIATALAVRRSPQVRLITHLVSATLGEPHQRARAIAASSLVANRMHYITTAWLAGQSPASRQRFIAGLGFPDEADVRRVLGGLRRGLLVVSIHADGYLPGILRLCTALRPGLRVNLVKREQPGPQDAVFDDPQPRRELRILRTRDRPGLTALAALRAGEVVCIMLDVPPSLDGGPSYPAPALGGELHLPRGPGELAARAGALILPVVATGRAIHCAPLIDAARPREVPRQGRITHVQSKLARLVDRWIRVRPEDWMLWAHLPAFIQGANRPERPCALVGRPTARAAGRVGVSREHGRPGGFDRTTVSPADIAQTRDRREPAPAEPGGPFRHAANPLDPAITSADRLRPA